MAEPRLSGFHPSEDWHNLSNFLTNNGLLDNRQTVLHFMEERWKLSEGYSEGKFVGYAVEQPPIENADHMIARINFVTVLIEGIEELVADAYHPRKGYPTTGVYEADVTSPNTTQVINGGVFISRINGSNTKERYIMVNPTGEINSGLFTDTA